MIYKFIPDIKKEDEFWSKDALENLNEKFIFSLIKELSFNFDLIKKIEKDEQRFFADLAAALYTNFFSKNYTNRNFIIDLLLTTIYHLQLDGFKFLSFLSKEDAMLDIMINSETENLISISADQREESKYFSKWDFKNHKFSVTGSITTDCWQNKISNILDANVFSDKSQIFFLLLVVKALL